MVEDVTSEPSLAALREVILAEGIRALAFVPLVSHGQLLGKFMIYYDAPHVFSSQEMRLAASIAQHVGFGLAGVVAESAVEDLLRREQIARREAEAARVDAERLYEEARRRQREAEVVAELAQRINASLDLQTTLERLVEGARELCAGDIARIVVRERDTGRMVLRHQVGSRWTGAEREQTVEPGQGGGGIVLRTRTPFRTGDYARDRRISDHDLEAVAVDDTVSQIVVPIPGEPFAERFETSFAHVNAPPAARRPSALPRVIVVPPPEDT